MTTPRTWRRAFAAAAVACAAAAQAHGVDVGDLHLVHPFATPSIAGATNGAAYIKSIENAGKQPERLLRASTPVAARTEIHTMEVDAAGVMKMRELTALDIAPGATVRMAPGHGMHIMLMDLKHPLRDGEHFPMTLEFEHAGKVAVEVWVQPAAAAEKAH